MFIEDIIELLAEKKHVMSSEHDQRFLWSLARRSKSGKPLTTRQGYAFLRLLRKQPQFDKLRLPSSEYYRLLDSPQWRLRLIPSVEMRNEVRYLGDNFLAFRTSLSSEIVQKDFHALDAKYSGGVKVVQIANKTKRDRAIELIGREGFHMDSATEKFLAGALEFEKLRPTILLDSNRFVIDVPNEPPFAAWVHLVLGANPL